MANKRIKIERRKKDRRTGEIRSHISHLSEDVSMHLDIIDKLIKKCIKHNIPIEEIEAIWDNGYERED